MNWHTILTHSGEFHADDVFAVAAARMLAPAAGIVRTRAPERLSEAVDDPGTVVVDVGDVHDPARAAFDHHQAGFDREDAGVPVAAAGLFWETWGALVVRAVLDAPEVDDELARATALRVRRGLVRSVDAADAALPARIVARSGTALGGRAWDIGAAVAELRPVGQGASTDWDAAFRSAVDWAEPVLRRHILHARVHAAFDLVLQRNAVVDGCLELDAPPPRFDDFPTAAVHVLWEDRDGTWLVLATTADGNDAPTCPFPVAWRGLRNTELQHRAGVPDAVFCHRVGFIAGAASRAGALALLQGARSG